jgi:stage V sporulation protein SpoVS
MANSEVIGTGDLKQNFSRLKGGMETRTSRAMVVAAGGVLKKRAKAIAQANGSIATGAMVKNIVIKREPQAPAGTVQYHLGVRHGRDLSKKQKTGGKHLAVAGGRITVRYHDDPTTGNGSSRGIGSCRAPNRARSAPPAPPTPSACAMARS